MSEPQIPDVLKDAQDRVLTDDDINDLALSVGKAFLRGIRFRMKRTSPEYSFSFTADNKMVRNKVNHAINVHINQEMLGRVIDMVGKYIVIELERQMNILPEQEDKYASEQREEG